MPVVSSKQTKKWFKFIKCDPSNSLDDNENDLGNIKSLDGYTMPKSERECYVLRSEDECKSES